ncbi:MAG: HEPN domain-containing protein [Nitrospinae bacterium]|nr:HEPN domain-containing protein [Nitrospinota bacterium]
MEKRTAEWFRQSDYDLESAEYMLKGGRNIYSVFLCHLAVEKALKGLYSEKLNAIPPKTHNLVRLMTLIGITPPEGVGMFIATLSESGIPTRYPEDMEKMQTAFHEARVRDIIVKSTEVVTWIKKQ